MNRSKSILIRNNFIDIPASAAADPMSRAELATLMGNITHFGFALSTDAFEKVRALSSQMATSWWKETEESLKEITGANRKMEEHVVYKNFPQEVLDMTQGEYWFNQVLMYWGLPNHLFTTEAKDRPALTEKPKLKVLQPAKDSTLSEIFTRLVSTPSKWIEDQRLDVEHLAIDFVNSNPLSLITFKENLVSLASFYLKMGVQCRVNTSTDVLRLAAGLSDADISLREKVKFKNFTRPQRRYLLGMLEDCLQKSDAPDDFVRNEFLWKKLFKALRPGDYAKSFPKSCVVYDLIYRNELGQTFNSKVEEGIALHDASVLQTLRSRPGEFARRLRVCVNTFGDLAAEAFMSVVPKLDTIQLLKLRGNLEVMNERSKRAFPPKGNWNKLQVQDSTDKSFIPGKIRDLLVNRISDEITSRVSMFVKSVDLDDRMSMVKLQTNDNELSEYGRGTTFQIPEGTSFIRSSSFWKSGPTHGHIWYDNGWNFFDSNWKSVGACCWNANAFGDKAAIFSGDPTNAKDLEGRACQMIDLYPHKLKKAGVRYAVWNILAYSNIAFSEAQDVLGTLQWGEKAEAGKLFEPSRCQMNFQLKGDNKTKYLALIDLERMELVYLDANLFGSVHSAASNGTHLEKNLPAFMEYVETIPTVADIFRGIPRDPNGLKVVYDDSSVSLDGETAFVFRPQNKDNSFKPFDLTTLL